MSNVSRRTFDALLPKGSAWDVEKGSDLDNLLDGLADNTETIREYLFNLAYLRDPKRTPIFTDLEKEYGLFANDRLTTEERVNRLIAARVDRSGFGADYMERKLRANGFDLQVHINDPPVDPNLLLNKSGPQFNFPSAIFGEPDQVFTGSGIEAVGGLIVNGDIYIETVTGPPTDVTRTLVEYSVPTADLWEVTFGNEKAVFDYRRSAGFDSSGNVSEITEVVFGVKRDWSKYWALVFFVGGDATRDSITGELTDIFPADVSTARQDELKRLIVTHKPAHSWCGLIVNFI